MLSRWQADALRKELLGLRNRIVEQKKAAGQKTQGYHIFNTNQCDQILEMLPRSLAALRDIDGFGVHKVKEYGPEIVRVVCEFVRPQCC